MQRTVTNFFDLWEKSEELEKKLAKAIVEAISKYPDVHVSRIHDSILLEGKPEDCESFLELVKELTNA